MRDVGVRKSHCQYIRTHCIRFFLHNLAQVMESDSDLDESFKNDVSLSRDFNRLRETFNASGYREGAGAGKDAGFQPGFDKGFSEGFSSGFALGLHNGIIKTLEDNSSTIPKVSVIEGKSFPNARHGLCQICNNKSIPLSTSSIKELNTSKNVLNIPEVSNHQRQFTRVTLQSFKPYLSEVLQDANLNTLSDVINESCSQLL